MQSFLKFTLTLISLLFSLKLVAQPKKVYIQLSVDWEGDTLRESNLQAMKKFNETFPDFPVIHFLNAAYYTKKNFPPHKEITQQIRSVLKENDELGLHIHAWENLIKASDVKFKNGPSFWNTPSSLGRNGELGDDVPINLYSENEIFKIIQTSLKILKKHGFINIKSFRGGGWMSGPKVHRALKRSGIFIDSSAVPPGLVERLYPNTLLSKINQRQWPQVSIYSKPYQNKAITQFPNNAGLADYLTEEDFFKIYLQNLKKTQENNDSEVYLHFGWHQESAVEYFEHGENGEMVLMQSHFLERVVRGLKKINEHAKRHGHIVVPIGFSDFKVSRQSCTQHLEFN